MNKEQIGILKKYVSLARKLGKLPSVREIRKFICSSDKLYNHFESLPKLKAIALHEHPELVDLDTPATLTTGDVEAYRIDLERKKTKKDNAKLVTDVSTLEYIARFAEHVFKGRVEGNKSRRTTAHMHRTHTLVLSDLHFGADIKGDETGVEDFGRIEEARRFAAVIKEASLYKAQYREKTHLEILILGDIIENQLHDPRTGDVLAIQCCRAIHLLVQGIAYLANCYPTVTVRFATGNHGRNTSRHHGRAVHQKHDSLETIVYYAVKEACANLRNVSFHLPMTPMGSYEVYGKKIGYTHGDTVITPGNPGNAINVRGMEHQVNRINSSLHDQQEYAAIVYGHTHVSHLVWLSNGTVLIGNGSLPPPDPFAVSIGIMETSNGQWIFESVPDHAVGDLRLLKVTKDYNTDNSLDTIIKPFRSL